jgi:hypothetical protein
MSVAPLTQLLIGVFDTHPSSFLSTRYCDPFLLGNALSVGVALAALQSAVERADDTRFRWSGGLVFRQPTSRSHIHWRTVFRREGGIPPVGAQIACSASGPG